MNFVLKTLSVEQPEPPPELGSMNPPSWPRFQCFYVVFPGVPEEKPFSRGIKKMKWKSVELLALSEKSWGKVWIFLAFFNVFFLDLPCTGPRPCPSDPWSSRHWCSALDRGCWATRPDPPSWPPDTPRWTWKACTAVPPTWPLSRSFFGDFFRDMPTPWLLLSLSAFVDNSRISVRLFFSAKFRWIFVNIRGHRVSASVRVYTERF